MISTVHTFIVTPASCALITGWRLPKRTKPILVEQERVGEAGRLPQCDLFAASDFKRRLFGSDEGNSAQSRLEKLDWTCHVPSGRSLSMRLLRCLIMILATLSMAGLPASAKVDHGHARHAAAQHLEHHHAGTVSAHVGDEALPCAGHHGPKAHDDGQCCGMACCGPSCLSTATSIATGSRLASTIASLSRPSADTLVDGTSFSLPDRPPIAG